MAAQNQITVTTPLLPNLEEYNALLQDIWNRKWITNNGYYHQQLEQALSEYLCVPYISLFTNGTLPFITALQALGIHYLLPVIFHKEDVAFIYISFVIS